MYQNNNLPDPFRHCLCGNQPKHCPAPQPAHRTVAEPQPVPEVLPCAPKAEPEKLEPEKAELQEKVVCAKARTGQTGGGSAALCIFLLLLCCR